MKTDALYLLTLAVIEVFKYGIQVENNPNRFGFFRLNKALNNASLSPVSTGGLITFVHCKLALMVKMIQIHRRKAI